MGKISVEGMEPPRRPLYLLSEEDPYTLVQLQALHAAYVSDARGGPFNPYWPRVRDEARKYVKALELQKMLKPHRNVWWRINRAVRLGTVAELLKTCPQDADALLYGAMRADVVTSIVGRRDYEDEIAQLRRLDADERKVALAAAKAEGSILWKKTGRPSGGPVEDFATFLGKFYVETTGRPLSASLSPRSGEFDGPAIRFMHAALAPFYRSPEKKARSPSIVDTPNLRSFLMRVRLPGSEELFPPPLESAGLRSLILRVKAKSESSEP